MYVFLTSASVELRNWFIAAAGSAVGRETDGVHAFRPAIVKLLAAFGCTSPFECVRWYDSSSDWGAVRKAARSTLDGQHHQNSANHIRTVLQALMTLALAGSDSSVVETSWVDSLPAEHATTLASCNIEYIAHASARVLGEWVRTVPTAQCEYLSRILPCLFVSFPVAFFVCVLV